MEKADGYHVPVMLAETLAGLQIKLDGRYLDTTSGGGGHCAALLDKLSEHGRLLAIDRDDEALSELRNRFATESRIVIRKLNFSNIGDDDQVRELMPFDGILFDFGVSSHQIDDASRGFSFMQSGPLDMRMDRAEATTAADVVNSYEEQDLIRVLRDYGEEPRARKIAQQIVHKRPFDDTAALVRVLDEMINPRDRVKTLARVFQAIRIEVNGELDAIDQALQAAYELLCPGGRLVALSYHSLEDKRVKRFVRRMEGQLGDRYSALSGFAEPELFMRAVPRKAVVASAAEIERNPRARSARLRIAEKVR